MSLGGSWTPRTGSGTSTTGQRVPGRPRQELGPKARSVTLGRRSRGQSRTAPANGLLTDALPAASGQKWLAGPAHRLVPHQPVGARTQLASNSNRRWFPPAGRRRSGDPGHAERLNVGANESDQLRMCRDRARVVLGPVLEAPALAGASGVGTGSAGAGPDHRSPYLRRCFAWPMSFLVLSQTDQAHEVAHNAVQALEARVTPRPETDLLSYGAFHLVLARGCEGQPTHRYLDTACAIAEQLSEDRNDCGAEFGPRQMSPCGTSADLLPSAKVLRGQPACLWRSRAVSSRSSSPRQGTRAAALDRWPTQRLCIPRLASVHTAI